MLLAIRLILGSALTLIAAYGYYAGTIDVWGWTRVWFLLAVALGVLVGRWQTLVFGFIPWPLAIGVGLITGRFAFLGEGGLLLEILVIGIGLLGILIGFATSRAGGWAFRKLLAR